MLIGPSATGTDSVRAEPQPRAHRRHPRRQRPEPRDRDRRHRRAPATPRRPAASTTSSSSTCRPAASPRRGAAGSSSAASSPRSCRRSACPSSRTRLHDAIEAELAGAPSGCRRDGRVRVCGVDDLEADTAAPRRSSPASPIAVVQDSNGDDPRHRRHLHPRRHLARRGLRRGRHPRVLGARLEVLPDAADARSPCRPTSRCPSSGSWSRAATCSSTPPRSPPRNCPPDGGATT